MVLIVNKFDMPAEFYAFESDAAKRRRFAHKNRQSFRRQLKGRQFRLGNRGDLLIRFVGDMDVFIHRISRS